MKSITYEKIVIPDNFLDKIRFILSGGSEYIPKTKIQNDDKKRMKIELEKEIKT